MDAYANINAEYFVAVHMQITTGKALSRFPVYDTQAIGSYPTTRKDRKIYFTDTHSTLLFGRL